MVDSAKTGLLGDDYCAVQYWQWNLSITDDKKLKPQGSLSVRFTRLKMIKRPLLRKEENVNKQSIPTFL